MSEQPTCRVCGASNDTHTAAGSMPAVPHDGDVSLCLYCGAWSVFAGGQLREPSAAEAELIRGDPDCAQAERICAMLTRGRMQ